jgi:protein SDA1
VTCTLVQVMTVGLKTVRELCIRCPLVMDEALLSDLALYKKEKDKHVKNAAKALVALFRELKPSMLVKKERGRGADLGKELEEFGAADFKLRCSPSSLCQNP